MHISFTTRIKRKLREWVGDPIFYRLGYAYLIAQPKYRESIARIRLLRNRHLGQRCFIIGNGPSLKNMDLSLLASEFTFGLNRIYMMFDQLGFNTTYYVVVNKLIVQQCADEILEKVSALKFISYDARRWIRFVPDLMFLYCREGPWFYQDVTKGVWQGATVTYTAMQLAYYMGFKQVIMIGVDHSYQNNGKPNETVVSQGDDPNHFDPGYFGKGFRWQLPDLETSELAYRMAKAQFEMDGREIVDATVNGKLDVFRKVNYTTLFGKQ